MAKKVFGWFLAIGLIVAFLAVWKNAYAIEDWYRLRNYTPPANVATLVHEDTMTPYSTHLFYVNHPNLFNDAAAFRQDCAETEQTIVLGCYHPEQNGIAVYNVQDARLKGVQEVTAAHEMLHAAYERLSPKDKTYVNGLLTNYYNNDLHDQRIIDTMNSYKKTEPNDVVNEMHSVFGTEIANLPAPLENYYKKYFANREAVTNFAAGYQAEFTSRTDQINADDAQLADLKQQISSDEQSLSNQLSHIEADRRRLDSLQSSGQISAYNAGVSNFNSEVNAYNAGVARLRSEIARYNDLVNTRNALAAELRSLDSALDTRLTTQTAQ
jgi:uncharacterized protein YukE